MEFDDPSGPGEEPRRDGEKPVVVTVDDRERASGLPDAVARLWSGVAVGRLTVGDIEVGPGVLIERKTVHDFVASLADGRLYAQAYALSGASRRPLLIVEGRDGRPFMAVHPDALRGVLLTLMTSYRLPVLRTDDVAETALALAQIARNESRRLERRRLRGLAPEPSRPERVAADMLGAIPGVGDLRARTLLDAFGSVDAVLRADERALRSVAGIGPTTARTIRGVVDPPIGAPPPRSPPPRAPSPGAPSPGAPSPGAPSPGDRPHVDRPHVDRPHVDRPHVDRPHVDRPHVDRPRDDRPRDDRPRDDRPRDDRPRGPRAAVRPPRGDDPRGDHPPGGREVDDRPTDSRVPRSPPHPAGPDGPPSSVREASFAYASAGTPVPPPVSA